MSFATATEPEDGPDPRRALGQELARHARLLHVVRALMSENAPRGLDFSSLTLLLKLVQFGPQRQGELAERALLDPSTTSRYTAQLVRADLVARQPDPDDGRAVLLAATPEGERVAADLFARRDAIVGAALADWPRQDVVQLTTLLHRLNDELDQLRPTLRAVEVPASQRES